MAEDLVRGVMKDTGISVLDLLSATVEIARRECPSELVRRRDDILQGLYGVHCSECTEIGGDLIVNASAPIEDIKTQHQMVVKRNPNQERPSSAKENKTDQELATGMVAASSATQNHNEEPQEKRRPPLRVVIRLRKNKNSSMEATERSKSEVCDTETTKRSKLESCEMEAIEISKSKSQEPDQFQKVVPKKEEITQKRLKDATRKLRENYEMAASSKKQRCVKMLSIDEIPKQVTHAPHYKAVTHARSGAVSRFR